MSLWLREVRLFVTTKDRDDANTDEQVLLEYDLGGGLKNARLNRPWDDRERAHTEMHIVSIDPPELGTSVDPR